MMIDSGLLESIRFVKFGNTFLRFLYENNGYNLFCEREEVEAWKKFLDLLIPPKDYWKSNVYGQCKSWLDDGLKPRAVTRDLDWGVPVPVKGADGKVLYVWFDAPIGYISSTKEWAHENKKDWKKYWKDNKTQLIHFIGKDNIVFHCIIFPSMLKAHGDFIVPKNVPANEFLNLEGSKISTSSYLFSFEFHVFDPSIIIVLSSNQFATN